MKKILLALSVSLFSVAYSQNLSFTDSKFKALILSSNPNNEIARDFTGTPIAIDANGDGEIQIPEAQQVKILSIQQDPNQMYIDPNGNPGDVDNINIAYYNNHLPDGITDVLLFPNIEELYFWTTKSATISFINNNKITTVKGKPYYYDFNQQGQYIPSPINLSFNNCSGIQNINNIIAYQSTLNPVSTDENILKIKNCTQIDSDAVINLAELTELYIENSSINTLTFNSCKLLKKIHVPNLSTLTKIFVLGSNGISSTSSNNQNIELIANNCINLQEIIADTDHYETSGAYFSSVNLNSCTSLKKIKGLNSASVNFSTSGLVNLEELDCSFYNRYTYYTSSGVYFGNVVSLNLSGLPKLKILKAFNQPITNNINFNQVSILEDIDITNSCGYMNTVNVSNLANLLTLKSDRTLTNETSGNADLKNIIANNCPALVNLQIDGNYLLENLNLQNCSSLSALSLGFDINSIFTELNTLNIKQCMALADLNIRYGKISSLDLSQCPSLQSFYLGDLALFSNLNTLNNGQLKSATFTNCPLISHIDLSSSSMLESLGLWNMLGLTYANIKNGALEATDLYKYNDNLTMCVDAEQITDLQTVYPDIIFTSSCPQAF